MENLDREAQRRVWQRVRGEAPSQGQETPREQGLMGLIAREREDGAMLTQLSRQMGMLRAVAAQCSANAACLTGIYTMITGKRPPLPPLPRRELPRDGLRQCYARRLQAMDACRQRAEDREYGAVFGQLAARCAQQCQQLLEALGQHKLL